jgi:hypothetical protein
MPFSQAAFVVRANVAGLETLAQSDDLRFGEDSDIWRDGKRGRSQATHMDYGR